MNGRIKEAAIAATVEICITLRAGFPFTHSVHAYPLYRFTTFPATDPHGLLRGLNLQVSGN